MSGWMCVCVYKEYAMGVEQVGREGNRAGRWSGWGDDDLWHVRWRKIGEAVAGKGDGLGGDNCRWYCTVLYKTFVHTVCTGSYSVGAHIAMVMLPSLSKL